MCTCQISFKQTTQNNLFMPQDPCSLRKNLNQKFQSICTRINSNMKFRGIVLINCFSSISNFVQISKFKMSLTPREENLIKSPWEDAHIHGMSFITTKLHETLWSSFRGTALTTVSVVYVKLANFKVQKGHKFPKKIIKISCKCAFLHSLYL